MSAAMSLSRHDTRNYLTMLAGVYRQQYSVCGKLLTFQQDYSLMSTGPKSLAGSCWCSSCQPGLDLMWLGRTLGAVEAVDCLS